MEQQTDRAVASGQCDMDPGEHAGAPETGPAGSPAAGPEREAPGGGGAC